MKAPLTTLTTKWMLTTTRSLKRRPATRDDNDDDNDDDDDDDNNDDKDNDDKDNDELEVLVAVKKLNTKMSAIATSVRCLQRS